ncbi:g6797 [Coccomyxa viridis]|uniref:G6797 protein n=1 Tax=Coccomyxa viridis TaxID=1274662 RepID=A0ABP1G090_9CHLO
MHRIDRRLERVSINMSLLEDKVDSAVASHETAELAKRSVVEVSSAAVDTQAHADEPPSTTASASDGMEEIDTGPPVPGPSHSREDLVANGRLKLGSQPGSLSSQQQGQGSSR